MPQDDIAFDYELTKQLVNEQESSQKDNSASAVVTSITTDDLAAEQGLVSTQKIAPLPTWLWPVAAVAAAALVATAVLLLVRRRRTSAAALTFAQHLAAPDAPLPPDAPPLPNTQTPPGTSPTTDAPQTRKDG
jgi:negative regulator of sigma E activity